VFPSSVLTLQIADRCIGFLPSGFVDEKQEFHYFISPFRPQDGNKPAETSQPQSSTGGYNQPSLGYGQSNYSYPQVPGSYPMQPVTAPPSYPPTRSVSSFCGQ
jgi:hypothetical protein